MVIFKDCVSRGADGVFEEMFGEVWRSSGSGLEIVVKGELRKLGDSYRGSWMLVRDTRGRCSREMGRKR
jgi:hypothetical protein